jgi:hypothetical protein
VSPHRLAIPVLVSVVLTAVLTAAVAVALIPDQGGVIHGCRNKKSGELRVIDQPTKKCKSNETALDWNQAGAQGPAGPEGPEGAQGPAGAAADLSSLRSYRVVVPINLMPGERGSAKAWCEPGDLGTGGGFSGDETHRVEDNTADFGYDPNEPGHHPDAPRWAWTVGVRDTRTSGARATVHVNAMCVDITPPISDARQR